MSIDLCVFMNTIGERLKSERTRLGFNQTEFAAIGGVQRRAQLFYEQDERRPDAGYLQAVARLGVDVQFVVTGIRSGQALSLDEEQLLARFRNLDLMGKARLLGMVEGIGTSDTSAPSQTHKRNIQMTIHGSVGQQITGDITAPQNIIMGRKKVKVK
ncbi:helix-turn-helix domain-containing protein [Herbaspirillum huttiense]|uniref:helix-turn-helix domain-containing protein n=1 Tax=Herbaspirillum huttiense TaxID=863372 RepID=UPI00382FFC8A